MERIYWVSKYIAYRSQDEVLFGQDVMKVCDFCSRWQGFQGKTFLVRAWCGPPGRRGWYSLSLADYCLDWYYDALAKRSDYMLQKFEGMFAV